ncbi:phospholipase effector Tle1 domain-containing protein [Lysobacter cavernae]|uniref:Phospholipase effector Tle1 domain-containing protein n=1 Tax=Lysobacter cavernae TaxID=1685901 RepID=A0ABV7RQD7_9GAMM
MSIDYVSKISGQVDLVPGSPDPIPDADATARTARLARGMRKLTDQERRQRQDALACTAPEKEEAMTGCTQTLHYTVFFDGTGNNLEQDRDTGAMSNIAKLSLAHKPRAPNILPDYIPGVGTPFDKIGDEGGTPGLARGARADDRIDYALKRLDELIDSYPAEVKILLVNVNVFGFSRGAAQARAFIRDLTGKCKQDDGRYHYRDKPIRIAFAGLFDTVCSAWERMFPDAMYSRNGGHNGWAEDVKLSGMVEQSVHMTAAHEARRLFPLDSTRVDARYPDNAIEIWYPGVHSDVGGGYAPDYQGRENTIARFALHEMYDMAFAAGVLFQSFSDLPGRVQEEFNKDDPELREVYNAYLQAVPKKQGRLEEVQVGHMELLHRWLKHRVEHHDNTASMARMSEERTRLEAELRTVRRERMRLESQLRPFDTYPSIADPKLQAQYETAATEERALRERLSTVKKYQKQLRSEDRDLDDGIKKIYRKREKGEHLNMAEGAMLRAWDNPEPLPEPVTRFFDRFSHDSIAHFGLLGGQLTDWRCIYFGDTKYRPVDVSH